MNLGSQLGKSYPPETLLAPKCSAKRSITEKPSSAEPKKPYAFGSCRLDRFWLHANIQLKPWLPVPSKTEESPLSKG